MIQNILTVGQQVLILFILIAIGFVCGKIKMLTENACKSMTNIVLYFVTPCVIIEAFNREYDPSMLSNLGITALCAVGVHLIAIILGSLLFKDSNDARRRVLRFAVVFSNCGFMSLPLQAAILGDEGVFYGAAFVAVFNVILWSYGIVSMSGDKKFLSPKSLILNPGILGVIIGLILFIFSVPLPTIVSTPIGYMADLNTPLPMIIIGFYLSQTKLSESLKDKGIYAATALRLVIVPLIALGIMYYCGVRGKILVACVIAGSAPIAAVTTMFSAKFNKDTQLSVNLVSFSTLCSIVTMSAIVGVAQFLA